MAKKPGLQADLQLQVDAAAFGGPAHVEDYLDRALPGPAQRPSVPPPPPRRAEPQEGRPAAGEARPRPEPPADREVERQPSPDAKVVELNRARQGAQARRPGTPQRRSERRELSIDAETSRMIDRLVSHLQEKTPQKDVTASEFVRSIIQLADESRHLQEFVHVHRRGQWGSPTARAFVADLKKAFFRAIARHFIEQNPKEAMELYQEARGELELDQ